MTSPMTPEMRRSLIALVVVLFLSGCATAFHHGPSSVPAPADAIGITLLSNHRVAVLAGTASAKAVSVLDLQSGHMLATFGVTREATGISAATPDGPLLLSIGERASDGPSIGAVESWLLTGVKQRVLPMPGAALGLTRAVDGLIYVLSGTGSQRTAIPIDLPTLRVGNAVPLEGGSEGLALCRFGASPVLVYADAGGDVDVRTVDSGQEAHSSTVGQNPTCLDGDARTFAISKALVSRSIIVLAVPSMQQAGSIGVSADAAMLYPDDDQGLLVLNEGGDASNIQEFDRAALALPVTQTAAK